MKNISLITTEEHSNEDLYEALIKDNAEALKTGDYSMSSTLTMLMDKINRLIELEE